MYGRHDCPLYGLLLTNGAVSVDIYDIVQSLLIIIIIIRITALERLDESSFWGSKFIFC